MVQLFIYLCLMLICFFGSDLFHGEGEAMLYGLISIALSVFFAGALFATGLNLIGQRLRKYKS